VLAFNDPDKSSVLAESYRDTEPPLKFCIMSPPGKTVGMPTREMPFKLTDAVKGGISAVDARKS
jgi:hypothetical protein